MINLKGHLAMRKITYINIMWVYNIYNDMLQIFLLYNLLLLNSTTLILQKIPNTDNPSNDITSLSYHLSYTIDNFFNTSLCFSDQSIFVIYSPTIFLNLLLFVIFNVLHQFSAYVLRSGSTYCMVYNHG